MSRYEGRLADIRGHIPEFNRHSFGLLQKGETATRLNERLDVIIRQPVDDDDDFVPVGIVSKGYVLVPHRHVAAMAVAAIRNLGVGEN